MWKTCLPCRLDRRDETDDDGGDCSLTRLNPDGGLKALGGANDRLDDDL